MATSSTIIADKYEQQAVVDVIRQTVCKGASDAQFKMFVEVCRSTGLNPFLREVWFVAEKGIIMAGRDGYLRIANEHPQFDGMETRVERDANNIPVKAVCTVWRKDRNHPVICEAYYDEYKKDSPVWRQYKSAMIGKVCEVLSLKRSFSITGVVTEEEIGYDGAGSKDSAAAVAEAKIAALRAKVPVAEVLNVEQETLSDLENTLQASIDMVKETPAPWKKKGGKPTKYDLLRAFAEMKKRYQAIGLESTYYAVLGRHSVEHSNEFPNNAAGGKAMWACYREMSLNVADCEAWTANKRDAGNPGLAEASKFD
jgi:phage recombination protein Bet